MNKLEPGCELRDKKVHNKYRDLWLFCAHNGQRHHNTTTTTCGLHLSLFRKNFYLPWTVCYQETFIDLIMKMTLSFVYYISELVVIHKKTDDNFVDEKKNDVLLTVFSPTRFVSRDGPE